MTRYVLSVTRFLGTFFFILFAFNLAKMRTEIRVETAIGAEMEPTVLPDGDTTWPTCPSTSAFARIVLSPFYERDRTLFFWYRSPYLAVLWRSTDDGESWRLVVDIPGPWSRIDQVAIVPQEIESSLTLYVKYWYHTVARDENRVARSTDGGITWDERTACDPNCIGVFATARLDTVFASRMEPYLITEPGRGILRSDDGGLTWQILWDHSAVWRVYVSPDFATDQLLFAATGSSHELPPAWLIVSTDGGNTWTGRDAGLGNNPLGGLAFSSAFSHDQTIFVYIGGTIFQSQNTGRYWQSNFTLNNDSIVDIAVSPDFAEDQTLFIMTQNDLIVSYDSGVNWHILIHDPVLYQQIVIGRRPLALPRSMKQDQEQGITLDLPQSTLSAWQFYLPLVGTTGVRYRPLSLFLTQTSFGGRTSYYNSDDGGLTWRCLHLPPIDD